MEFVHLNVHSCFSKGWGVSFVQEICSTAREIGIRRLALTDTNGLYGLMEFLKEAEGAGIHPIIGSELLFRGHRAVLLVKNQKGYENLCRILSDRHCDQEFDLINSIKSYRDGLVVISDDQLLLKKLKQQAMEDLFVELSPGYRMASCYAFSRETGIPPIATNRVYMAKKEQFYLHRILRAISLKTTLSRLPPEETCYPHNYLKSRHEMMEQFVHAPSAIANTERVADLCSMEIKFDNIVFPKFRDMEDREAYDLLYRMTLEGCRKRYGRITPEVKSRIDYEMKIIREKNFSHYFLVVADITRKTSRSCGRGSAAASIVSYALGITHVDPIRHNLFFDRFLNPGRKDPPDIDVDFPWDEREDIIENVFAMYGSRRVALVANHNGFGARASIREVARVFGIPEEEISRVTRRVGWHWHIKEMGERIVNYPEMKGIKLNPPWDQIFRLAARLEDRFNHLSTHCGGVVIVPDDIRKHCPVQISSKGLPVLQWEKDSVEDAGLVKIDILGNRSLAVIRDALAMVKENYGQSIDYGSLNPLDDPSAVKIFYDANTMGVFYFESPATRQVLKRVASGYSFDEYLNTDHFHLNVVVTSIIRPASNKSINEWVSRLHGQPWNVPHPLLEPVLRETLGIMVFQEQLSQAAIYLGGFDPAEADVLRKVVCKKNREKQLRDFYSRFSEGARQRGVPSEVIEKVWDMMMGFDGYSFCKPHSASYTLVAYKSAYLKAHYPAEFMASVISNQGGYYSTFGYISEAKRMGLRILPPCINQSQIRYTGDKDRIRIGLMQLKGLSSETKEAIIYHRKKRGPFASFQEFLGRMGSGIPFHDVMILIRAGCFDGIHGKAPRRTLIWQALRFYNQHQHTINLKTGKRNTVPYFIKRGWLRDEWETLGFPVSCHPLDVYDPVLKRLTHVSAKDLPERVGEVVDLIGWLITDKRVRTKDGEPMEFLTFEDRTGLFETVLFPRAYQRFCHLLNDPGPYVLRGRVEEDRGAITVNLEKVRRLSFPVKLGTNRHSISWDCW